MEGKKETRVVRNKETKVPDGKAEPVTKRVVKKVPESASGTSGRKLESAGKVKKENKVLDKKEGVANGSGKAKGEGPSKVLKKKAEGKKEKVQVGEPMEKGSSNGDAHALTDELTGSDTDIVMGQPENGEALTSKSTPSPSDSKESAGESQKSLKAGDKVVGKAKRADTKGKDKTATAQKGDKQNGALKKGEAKSKVKPVKSREISSDEDDEKEISDKEKPAMKRRSDSSDTETAQDGLKSAKIKNPDLSDESDSNTNKSDEGSASDEGMGSTEKLVPVKAKADTKDVRSKTETVKSGPSKAIKVTKVPPKMPKKLMDDNRKSYSLRSKGPAKLVPQ